MSFVKDEVQNLLREAGLLPKLVYLSTAHEDLRVDNHDAVFALFYILYIL